MRRKLNGDMFFAISLKRKLFTSRFIAVIFERARLFGLLLRMALKAPAVTFLIPRCAGALSFQTKCRITRMAHRDISLRCRNFSKMLLRARRASEFSHGLDPKRPLAIGTGLFWPLVAAFELWSGQNWNTQRLYTIPYIVDLPQCVEIWPVINIISVKRSREGGKHARNTGFL
jgi:hypothetical protein